MATERFETYGPGGLDGAGLIGSVDVEIAPEVTNARTVRDRAEQAIARMTQIADATNFTAAQRDQAIKDQAKAIRNLLRLALGRFDSAD